MFKVAYLALGTTLAAASAQAQGFAGYTQSPIYQGWYAGQQLGRSAFGGAPLPPPQYAPNYGMQTQFHSYMLPGGGMVRCTTMGQITHCY